MGEVKRSEVGEWRGQRWKNGEVRGEGVERSEVGEWREINKDSSGSSPLLTSSEYKYHSPQYFKEFQADVFGCTHLQKLLEASERMCV